MGTLKFSDLDPLGKHAVFWLANEADTLTTSIAESASHIGEILEAAAFMKEYPKGSAPHAILAARLRLGGKSTENILACIHRAAPYYQSIVE